jgi:hypothetical protein
MDKEKIPIIYKYDNDNDTAILCNGKGIQRVKQSIFLKMKNDDIEHVFIPMDGKSKTMKESFERFILEADALKKASKGVINLYITGSYVRTALDLFKKSASKFSPEPVKADEAEFIEGAMMASLIWSKPYEGELFQYDFVSFYPSLMRSKYLLFPIKRGEFFNIPQKYLDERPFYEMGIYRCTVDIKEPRLFRENLHGYYTHIELTLAQKLGYKITMIIDKKPNFLHYSRDKCVLGCHLFGEFVDLLFDLKKKQVPGAKGILNCLWGALAKKDNVNVYVDLEKGESPDIYGGKSIDTIENITETKLMYKLVNKNSVYKSNYARVAPFLLSKGRKVLSEAIQPNLDLIKRVHTDSMYSTKKLDVKTGDNLFDLKYVGYCEKSKVVNNAKPTGKFL